VTGRQGNRSGDGVRGPAGEPLRRWLPLAAGVAVAVAGIYSATAGGGNASSDTTGPLWISSWPAAGDRQILVVIDPASRQAAVYQVDSGTGGLSLKSTRDLTWDLLVDDFNAEPPTPESLRKMLETTPKTQAAPR